MLNGIVSCGLFFQFCQVALHEDDVAGAVCILQVFSKLQSFVCRVTFCFINLGQYEVHPRIEMILVNLHSP